MRESCNDMDKICRRLFLDYLRPCLAECVAVSILVFIGTLSLTQTDSQISALAYGFSTTLLLASFAKVSGAHMNPAVSLGVVIAGACPWYLGLLYVSFQLAGGAIGARFAMLTLPGHNVTGLDYSFLMESTDADLHPSFDMALVKALMTEVLKAFILMLTFIMTTVERWFMFAPICIGFVVIISKIISINLHPAMANVAMNPARAFGLAICSTSDPEKLWAIQWLYWVGPLTGAIIASLLYRLLFASDDHGLPVIFGKAKNTYCKSLNNSRASYKDLS